MPIDTHAELAALLRAAYPHFPDHFAGRRSWSYVRPEVRVVGRAGRGVIATAGALRRFIEVGGQDQLVAIVGLVAVHPEHQATGVGTTLMARVAGALADLSDWPQGPMNWHCASV